MPFDDMNVANPSACHAFGKVDFGGADTTKSFVRGSHCIAIYRRSSHAQLALEKYIPPISSNNPSKCSVSTSKLSDLSFSGIVSEQDHIMGTNKLSDVCVSLDLGKPRHNATNRLSLPSLPSVARSLHKQKLPGRNIMVTKDTDKHLVQFETQIFVRLSSNYLPTITEWIEQLCSDVNLHYFAYSLLVSYA
jgi:hypothetical protein